MRRDFRRAASWLHRRGGLLLAVLLSLQALGGFTLLWREQVRAVGAAAGPVRVELETALDLARAHAPPDAGAVLRIDLPRDAGWPYRVTFARAGRAPWLIDLSADEPAVLRSGSLWAFPLEAMFRLHESWFAGEAGRIWLVGLGTAAILATSVGVWLWWPGYRRLGRSLAVRRRPWPALLYDLHRSVGVLALPCLLVSLTTGTLLAARSWLQPSLAEAPARSSAATTDPAPSLSSLRASAERTLGADATSLRPGPEVVLVVFGNRAAGRTGRVWLDPANGETLRVYGRGSTPADVTLFDQVLAIHDGRRAGVAGRILVGASAGSLLLLGGTGLARWIRRRVLSPASAAGTRSRPS